MARFTPPRLKRLAVARCKLERQRWPDLHAPSAPNWLRMHIK